MVGVVRRFVMHTLVSVTALFYLLYFIYTHTHTQDIVLVIMIQL